MRNDPKERTMKTMHIIERMKENGNLVPAMVGAIGVLSFLTFVIAMVLLCTLYGCTDAGCTDGPGSTPAARTPLSATATLPTASGNGTLTRAFASGSHLSALTLYYPATTGTSEATATGHLSPYLVADADITQSNADFSFTTITGTFGTAAGSPAPLYWQQTAGAGLTAQTFYLTVAQEEQDAGIFSADVIAKSPSITLTADNRKNVIWSSAAIPGIPNGNADATRPALTFGTLKSRLARLTLILNCRDSRLKGKLLKAFVYTLPRDADEAANATSASDKSAGTGIYRQAWPIPSGASLVEEALINPGDGGNDGGNGSDGFFATFAGSTLIAPQALPASGTDGKSGARLLTIRYNVAEDVHGIPEKGTNGKLVPTDPSEPSYEWTLDLSTVAVKRADDSDFATQPSSEPTDGSGPGYAYAYTFGYNPGEHITLTVALSLLSLTPGDVQSQITDYEASTGDTNFGNIDTPVETSK